MPSPKKPPRPSAPLPPDELAIDRSAGVGRHRLLSVFAGLTEVPPFGSYPADAKERLTVARGTWIHVVDDTTWMYVAPHVAPPFAKAIGWEPVMSRGDCIVVGRRHLSKSPPITLYLDALHELYHIFQRRSGRDLWDISNGYAGSPTELEAYAFAIKEARRLGASDAYLRDYLDVEWIDRKEHRRLMKNLGVPPR